MGRIRLSSQAMPLSLVDAIVANTAAIAYSKLALSGNIQNSDIAGTATIDFSKLAMSAKIVNSHIKDTASIAYTKLDLSGKIVASDLAAGAGGANWVLHEMPQGSANGTNNVYTLATAPVSPPLVYVNGVFLHYDNNVSNNTSIDVFYVSSNSATLFTIGAPPEAGDIVKVCYVTS